MYTPCSVVADLLSTTGLQLVVMMGEKVVVYTVVVVTTLVYPEQVVVVMYVAVVNAGLQEVLLDDLLALVEKELHVIGVLMVASSLLQFLGVMV